MNAVIAERGQVTIPKLLRERLGLTPHTVVDFEEQDGRLIVTKVMQEDPVSRVLGCIRKRKGTNAMLRDLRGEP